MVGTRTFFKLLNSVPVLSCDSLSCPKPRTTPLKIALLVPPWPILALLLWHLKDRLKQRGTSRGRRWRRRLAALKATVESGQANNERVREYYFPHLRMWVGVSLEEIESIDQAIKILREKNSSKETAVSHSSHQDRPPMKSFILTWNAAQAKVFGAGYPSKETMMVHD